MGKTLKLNLTALIIAILLTALLKGGLFFDYRLNPDSCENINIARNLKAGLGYTLSIKWNYFKPLPVVHPAAGERPPLFPIILAGVLFFTDKLGLLMSALYVLNCFLLFIVARGFLSPLYAFLVLILAALEPYALTLNGYLDPCTLFLTLVLLSYVFRNKYAVGICCGLAWLTRPEGVLLLIAHLVFNRKLKPAMQILITAMMVMLPLFYLTWKTHDNPFYNIQQYHFVTKNIIEGDYNPYFKAPTVVEFFRDKDYLKYAVSRSGFFFQKYPLLLINPVWFTLPFIGLSFLGLIKKFKHLPGNYYPLLLYAGLQFLTICLLWSSSSPGDFKYFFGIRYIMLPVLVLGFSAITLTPLGRVLAMLSISLVILGNFQIFKNNCNPYDARFQARREKIPVLAEIAKLPPGTIIATSEAWAINYYTGKPTALLPRNFTPELLARFVRDYKIDYLLIYRKGELFLQPLPGHGLQLDRAPGAR